MTVDEPFDPFAELARAIEAARKAGFQEPEAMVVASVGDGGRPSARVVLCRGLDRRGLVFYTNLESRKGRELLARPVAACCFHWEPLGRQVRVEGRVERVSDEEADRYFASRARGSQIGAWASEQSRTLPLDEGRQALLRRVDEIERRYAGQPVPRPPHWSGLRVVPDRFEFWRRGDARLHDRDVYERDSDGAPWRHAILSP